MKKIAIFAGLLLASVMGLAQAAENPSIELVNAYARAVPPNAPNSAAFMLIHNHSDAERHLVSAESDVSDVTEVKRGGTPLAVIGFGRVPMTAGGRAVVGAAITDLVEMRGVETGRCTFDFDGQ